MDVLCLCPAYGNVPPGEGATESVHDPAKYAWLPKKFRYILSDECVTVPIFYLGKHYASIRHAMEAAKYSHAGSHAYHRMLQLAESSYAFTLNPIAASPPVKLKDGELKGWDEANARDAIYHATILQCPVRQQALLATQDAILYGDNKFHFKNLERIRTLLRAT